MAFNIKKQTSDTSWTTPVAGSIKIKDNGEWKPAIKVQVKQGGVWVDSGYVAYPNPATSFAGSGGNGDNKTVTFTWTAPSTGPTPTGYTLKIYSTATATTPIATKTVGAVGTTTYAFAASNTDYWVSLFTTFTSGGLTLESLTAATNSSSGTKLKVRTGAASAPYDNSRWGSNTAFTPSYWTQSTWPGEPYGDNTYRGDKAFDGNTGTYWTGQSWSWAGGSDWIGFSLGNALTPKIKIVELYNLPSGNQCSTINLDEFVYPNFGYTGRYWQGTTAFGYQVIPCDFEIAAGATRYFRFWYTDLGYNPTPYGNYRVLTSEISGTYQPWITDTGTTPATSNTVTNA